MRQFTISVYNFFAALGANCVVNAATDSLNGPRACIQGWAKEWFLGLQFFSSCMLRHRLSAGCVATKLNKKSPNLGTTL